MYCLGLFTDGTLAASSSSSSLDRFPPPPPARRRRCTPPERDMAMLRMATALCLLAGMLPLSGAIQVTVVCADLVGTGGVGIRVWPGLKASPSRNSMKMQFRLLQINWEAERLMEGDWVGVFDEDPRPPILRPPQNPLPPTSTRDWRTPQPLFWDTPYATHGTITTNFTQPRIELSVLARGGCVGPYVGFVRNGVCVAADCLASHPTWLYDHRAVLGSRSLRSLVLPGTHNSGSYSLADDSDMMAAWVVCQDEDIISQLLYGNRYLDLRVGYYPETHELLWVNHDLVRWRPLQDVLDGIRGFLALSPDPVIIDIHRTPVGFNLNESMELLLSLMNATLGGYFVHSRHGPHVTLDNLWQMGKRVIFTINDRTVSDYTPWVWPPVPQAWANAQLLDDLRSFLDGQMNHRFESPRLWAAMAHLTPTLWDLLFRSHVGVRGLTDRVNFSITRWLRQRWGHMANIVASDFFRGNDIINVAIRTNLALSMCRPTDPSRHPYTLRWTTELTLRHGSPSTTIPPFVRRMYTSGPVWNSTDVPRPIHYPFIPVDTNISMVFNAIPTRMPSKAPGVAYQDNSDTWREIFHYPTDGSPQPPEAFPTPSATTQRLATSTLRTTESSTRANVEAFMSEWDNVNSHDLVDEEVSYGIKDEELDNITSTPRMNSFLEDRESDMGSFLPSTGPLGKDTIDYSTSRDSGIISITTPSQLSRDNGDRDFNVDELANTDLSSATSNSMGHDGSMSLISGKDKENEYLYFTRNIQEDNDTSLIINDYQPEEYLLSATITAFLNTSVSSTGNATQDFSSLSSTENIKLNVSSLVPTDNTNNDSYVTLIDGISNTSDSHLAEDYLPVAYPTQTFPQDEVEYDNRPSEASEYSKDEGTWKDADAPPGTESASEKALRDAHTLPLRQASEHSVEQALLPKYSTEQTNPQTVPLKFNNLKVTVQRVPLTLSPLFLVPTEKTRSSTTRVTVRPETPSVRVQPTISAQPAAPTAYTQTLVSDVPIGKSSSKVT